MRKKLSVFVFAIGLCLVSPNVFAQSTPLTEEAIIQIAVKTAKNLGFKTEDMQIIFDKDNEKINGYLQERERVDSEPIVTGDEVPLPTSEEEYSELNDREYQAVYFAPKEAMKGGDIFVIIDKNTGEVIRCIFGK